MLLTAFGIRFPIPLSPDWLSVPPSPTCPKGTRNLFPWIKAAGFLKLIFHILLVPRLRIFLQQYEHAECVVVLTETKKRCHAFLHAGITGVTDTTEFVRLKSGWRYNYNKHMKVTRKNYTKT
jgi:hypothetical protein